MKINKAPIGSIVFFVIAVVLAIVLAIIVLNRGNIQFGGMDGGVLVNAAWQLHLGYRPYVDVVTAVPPLFLIGNDLAFDFWGVNWRAMVRITAVFAATSYKLTQRDAVRKILKEENI